MPGHKRQILVRHERERVKYSLLSIRSRSNLSQFSQNEECTVGIRLTDVSGNRMAISSPVTEWSGNQMARLRDYIYYVPTIQLPDTLVR